MSLKTHCSATGSSQIFGTFWILNEFKFWDFSFSPKECLSLIFPNTTNLKACNSSLVTSCMLSHSVGSGSWVPIDCSPPGSCVYGIFQAKNTGVGCHALLWRRGWIFPTQVSKLHLLCLLHCRWVLYPLRHWGSQSKLFRVLTGHIHELLLWHSMKYLFSKETLCKVLQLLWEMPSNLPLPPRNLQTGNEASWLDKDL